MNLNPFAENMIAIAGDIQYGLAQQELIYLHNYVDIPEVDNLSIYLDKMRAVMRGSIAYSIEIVTLSNSTLSGPEQCIALADYLDGLLRPVLESPAPPLHFTIAQLDTILYNARQQTKLLDALGTTQPIVNEIARTTSEIIDDANIAVDTATDAIREALLENNEMLLKGIRTMREYQLYTVMSIEYIARYRRGEKAAFDTLLAMQPSLKEVISSTTKPTAMDMRAIEDRLLYLLKSMHDVREQLMPDLELYWKQQRELDELTKDIQGRPPQGACDDDSMVESSPATGGGNDRSGENRRARAGEKGGGSGVTAVGFFRIRDQKKYCIEITAEKNFAGSSIPLIGTLWNSMSRPILKSGLPT